MPENWRERTDATIVNYRGELKCLFQFLRKNYADVTSNDIRAYLAWKQTSTTTRITPLTIRFVFQSFYKWLMNEDLLEDGGCLMQSQEESHG